MKNAPIPARERPLPHLQRDRLGTFYFRLTVDGRTRRKSLRTKDPALATMRAARLNYEWSMAKRTGEPSVKDVIESFKRGDAREFDVVLPNGMRIEKIETDEDVVRAKRFIESVEDIGIIAPEHRPLRPEYAHLAPARKGRGDRSAKAPSRIWTSGARAASRTTRACPTRGRPSRRSPSTRMIRSCRRSTRRWRSRSSRP